MFAKVIALVALSLAVANAATCHPQCKWLCDDPVCPAKCHPVCARPKCQMDCKPTECAKCEVHCEEPVCSVRCPKEMCEMEDCPACETVCRPAVCRTTCTAPEPNCSPLCEKTKCAWKCKTPELCPKPKCQLTCEKPSCDESKVFGEGETGGDGCCPCVGDHAIKAIAQADDHFAANSLASAHPKMSFLEVVHTMSQKANACCPCAN